MSGSDETTTATTPATTANLISVDIVRLLFPLALFQDFLHCADRVRQGLPYLVRQPHPSSHVCGFARDDEAPPRAAAHGVEHREYLVRCEAMGIHYPGRRRHIRRLDLEHGDGARRAATLRRVDE